MHKTNRTIEEQIEQRKKKIQALERLAGTLIITADDQIVTVQRADREKQKRQMRHKH